MMSMRRHHNSWLRQFWQSAFLVNIFQIAFFLAAIDPEDNAHHLVQRVCGTLFVILIPVMVKRNNRA